MNKKNNHNEAPVLFKKYNYIILLASLFLLLLGFGLMVGGGGKTDFDFNKAIFSNQRIIIAPIVVIIGYIGMIFAIFYNDSRD
tara:strand:+ start:408 stop:656 length:249 start_codon:yes stop_codon:yes gene_type:complete